MNPKLCMCEKIKIQPDYGKMFIKHEKYRNNVLINGSALEILLLCDGKNSLVEIKNKLCEKYEDSFENVSNLVDNFLKNLEDAKLLTYVDTEQESDIRIVGNYKFWTPSLISLQLTHICPLSCKHCYMGDKESVSIELNLAKKIIQEAYELGVDIVQLTGGEILAYKELGELLEYASKLDIEIQLSTSGFINNKELYDKLSLIRENSGLIQVSLDGNEEYHNFIRNNQSSYHNALDFIKNMRSRDVEIVIGTCYINQTYEEMSTMIDIIKELGVNYLRISTVSFRGNAEKDLIIDKEYNKNSDDLIKRLKNEYDSDSFKISFNENEKKYIDDNFKNCGYGKDMIKISPDGNIYPCIMSDIVIGNIKKESLYEFLLKNYKKNYNLIESPNIKYCNDCDNIDECSNCIEEGLKYGKENSKCEWIKINKKYIEKVLIQKSNNANRP